jgi:hypothetical protein
MISNIVVTKNRPLQLDTRYVLFRVDDAVCFDSVDMKKESV